MNKRIGRASRGSSYFSFRRAVGRFIEALEYYSSRFFGEGSNPFVLTGAIVIGLVFVSVATGLLMLLYYTPTPENAATEVERLTDNVRFGSLLRATHRTSADFIVIVLLIHMIRVWATGRHTGPRARSWLIGLLALPLIGIIGWSGYILPWDDRAIVLLAWGKDIAYGIDKWPIIGLFKLGSLIGAPVFAASSEADQLLRIFALHIGGAFLVVALVLWHLRRVHPARAKLPAAVWVGLLLVLLLVAAMIPLEAEELRAFNPFSPAPFIRVDAIVLFPLLFAPVLGGAVVVFLIALVLAGLAYLPRLERKPIQTAAVVDRACVGCRLCLNDCPYCAIEMVPHPLPEKRRRGREIAKVLPQFCSACGICVGSCAFGAIELPDLTSENIESRIDVLTGGEAQYMPGIPLGGNKS